MADTSSALRVLELMRLEVRSGWLAVLIVSSLQFFAVLIAVAEPTSQRFAGVLLFLLLMHMYDLEWLHSRRGELDLRLQMLAVTTVQIQVARFLLRFLLFGWIYPVGALLLAVLAPSALGVALAKFVLPGLTISLLTTANLLLFMDLATITHRNPVIHYLCWFLATWPLFMGLLLMTVLSNVGNQLANWLQHSALTSDYYMIFGVTMLVAVSMIILDTRIAISQRYNLAVQHRNRERNR